MKGVLISSAFILIELFAFPLLNFENFVYSFITVNYVYEEVGKGLCSWVHCAQSPEEGIRYPRAGATGDSESSDEDTRNWTQASPSSPFFETTEQPLQLYPESSTCVLHSVFTFALWIFLILRINSLLSFHSMDHHFDSKYKYSTIF